MFGVADSRESSSLSRARPFYLFII